jgi:peptide/nickel transport system substrate-binding protein
LVVTSAADPPFFRDFNPFTEPLNFTRGGIYEPLVVVTSADGGRQYDWLASGFSWSADRRTLYVHLRQSVRWSDGVPLTSADVVYTLTAGRRSAVMDQIGLTRPGNEISSVRALGSDEVAIRLEHVDSQFIETVLANNLVILPEHILAHVKSIKTWRNPNPVGTGPFTVVERVGTQSYTLGRNPHYWQAGRPRFACIERVGSTSTESALLQMDTGAVDLSNNLIPNAQKAYVAHDPAHFHYFYPATEPGIGLFLDDTRYPFSIVALRKAISLAIDRRKLRLAEYQYAPTVDALGIDHVWRGWIARSVAAQAKELATYDPTAARRLLLSAGFTYSGTTLLDPRGSPVVMNATVIASWADWYADWGLIIDELQQIGITVKLDATPDIGAWFGDAFATKQATLLWNTADDTTTPYAYFTEHLDQSSFVPSGSSAEVSGDWEHFSDGEATRLLAQFRSTSDSAAQHRLAARLEQIWLDKLPFVPLFAAPLWSTYSTRYFVGFPGTGNDYVQPDMASPDYVVALTRIRPRT